MHLCKRCLVRDLDEKEAFNNMFTYIAQLDDAIKVKDEIYEKRLETCKGCEALVNGMCKYCGCFVEMRAAVEKNYCPNKKW